MLAEPSRVPTLAAATLLAIAAPTQTQFAENVHAAMPAARNPSSALAAADVNADGHVDLLVGNTIVVAGWQNGLYLGDGTGHFVDVTTTHLPAGRYRTEGAAFGDVDGDGDPDLVTATDSGDQNQLYLNDGTGKFTRATFGRLPTDATSCRALVLADFDGDADLDVAFASYRQDLLYLNDGTGVFTDVTSTKMVPNATSSWDIVAGDVDADGDLDLVLAEQLGHVLLLNDGAANFSDATGQLPSVAASTSSLAFGDVDGDTDLDLISGYWFGPPTIFQNDGAGGFTDASFGMPGPAPSATSGLAFGDVDGDGDGDLVLAVWTDRFASARLLFENNGTGSFTDATATQMLSGSTNQSSALLLADVDHDADLDLLWAEYLSQDRLMLNDGAGTFADVAPSRLYAVFDVPWAVALRDLDGDGDADLVSANGFDDWQSWPNRLHRNDGHGNLVDDSAASLPNDNDESRALAVGDVDGDGDEDLVFGNMAGQNKLYRNDGTATFSDATAARLPAATDATTALALGDVTGNGAPDLRRGQLPRADRALPQRRGGHVQRRHCHAPAGHRGGSAGARPDGSRR